MPASVVILWWGAEIRILGGDGTLAQPDSGEPEDPVPRILRAVRRAALPARSARIIYHPDNLDVHEVTCPNTSRSRLGRILGREIGAMNEPGAVWTAEPIRKGPNGFATILYVERGSRLAGLVDSLALGGVHVEGVWPLQSLVEAVPPFDRDDGGFASLVAIGSRTLVSCIGPSGDRSVRFFADPASADAAIAALGGVLARFDEGMAPPGLRVVDGSPHADAFAEALRGQSLSALSPAEFLGHARSLRPRSYSDFLRPKPLRMRLPAARHLKAIAGIAFILGSGWFDWEARQDQARNAYQIATWRERHAQLEESVRSRTAIRNRIGELKQELRRAQGAAQAHYDFLRALGSATPDTMALQSLTIQDGVFTLKGHIYEGAGRPDNPLPQFVKDLSDPSYPWLLADASARTPTADFTLTGSFRPSAPAGAAP